MLTTGTLNEQMSRYREILTSGFEPMLGRVLTKCLLNMNYSCANIIGTSYRPFSGDIR
jgi:hypothetical protein